MNAPALRSALATALAARPAFTGVDIRCYPPGDLATKVPSLFFDEAQASVEGVSLANDGLSTWTLTGGVFVAAKGASDEHLGAAEQSVIDLLADLNTYLEANPKVGGVVHVRLSAYTVRVGEQPLSAGAEFTLSVREML